MKQVAMEGAALFLPQEIITNILKCLPVKSLIRFQCVCKDWKNLIKSPSFIAAHLHRSTQHRSCLVFHRFLLVDRLRLYSLDREMQIVEAQNIPVVDGTVRIVGSNNGLLCLRVKKVGSPPSFLLWNPAFREVRKVDATFPCFGGDYHMGFGFSPIVNDYKIVCLTVSHDDNRIHFVDVYSFGIGSWKQIEDHNLEGLCLDHQGGFNMNGAIFWFGFKKDYRELPEYVIVSFDIATEEFAFIPGPALDLRYRGNVILTEFEHRLALLYSYSPLFENSDSLIELWVLEGSTGGSGKAWSWAKKYTSGPYLGMFQPLTIWRNEVASILYLIRRDEEKTEFVQRTVMSNLTNTELKVLFDDRVYSCFHYVESLVSVSNILVEES